MSSNTLKKRCPKCKRKRKFTAPPEHILVGNWQKRDGVWVCPWCIARETPSGVQDMILERQKYLAWKKQERKKWKDIHLASKVATTKT